MQPDPVAMFMTLAFTLSEIRSHGKLLSRGVLLSDCVLTEWLGLLH